MDDFEFDNGFFDYVYYNENEDPFNEPHPNDEMMREIEEED
jgi:hypothetical protein